MLAAGCSSSNDPVNEASFYGMWVKGNQAGDTLQFMRKNNKNIMRGNMSFNASLPMYSEVEYKYINGKLAVEFAGAGSEMKVIESFTWKKEGKEFDILGFQLYLIMSSSVTHFVFTKVN